MDAVSGLDWEYPPASEAAIGLAEEIQDEISSETEYRGVLVRSLQENPGRLADHYSELRGRVLDLARREGVDLRRDRLKWKGFAYENVWVFPEITSLDSGNSEERELLKDVVAFNYALQSVSEKGRDGTPLKMTIPQLAISAAILCQPSQAQRNGTIAEAATGEGKTAASGTAHLLGAALGQAWLVEPFESLTLREGNIRNQFPLLGLSVGVLGENTPEGLLPSYRHVKADPSEFAPGADRKPGSYSSLVLALSTDSEKRRDSRGRDPLGGELTRDQLKALADSGTIKRKAVDGNYLGRIREAEDILSSLGEHAERNLAEAESDLDWGAAGFSRLLGESVPENPIFSLGKDADYFVVDGKLPVLTERGRAKREALIQAYRRLLGEAGAPAFKEGTDYQYLPEIRRARLTEGGAKKLLSLGDSAEGGVSEAENLSWYEIPFLSWAVSHQILGKDTSDLRICTRKEAYSSDVVVGSIDQFTFDRMFDSLADSKDRIVQRKELPAFTLIDEPQKAFLRTNAPNQVALPVENPFKSYEKLYEEISKENFRVYKDPGEGADPSEKAEALGIKFKPGTDPKQAVLGKARELAGKDQEIPGVRDAVDYLVEASFDAVYSARTKELNLTASGEERLGRTILDYEKCQKADMLAFLISHALTERFEGTENIGAALRAAASDYPELKSVISNSDINRIRSAVSRLVPGKHFAKEPDPFLEKQGLSLTEEGYAFLVSQGILPEGTYDELTSVENGVKNLLVAKYVLERNKDYTVIPSATGEPTLVLLDEDSRAHPGIRFQGGLQEALLAVCDLEIPEYTTMPTLVLTPEVMFFNQRPTAATTATASENARAFRERDRLEISPFPTEREYKAFTGDWQAGTEEIEAETGVLRERTVYTTETGDRKYDIFHYSDKLVFAPKKAGRIYAESRDRYFASVGREDDGKPLKKEDLAQLAHFLALEKAVVREKGRGNASPVSFGAQGEYCRAFSKFLELGNVENNLLYAETQNNISRVVANAGEYGAVTVTTAVFNTGEDPKLRGSSSEPNEVLIAADGSAQEQRYHIIHAVSPETLEAQIQADGRAGRRGEPASSEVILSENDPVLADAGVWDGKRRYSLSPERTGNGLFIASGAGVSDLIDKAQRTNEEKREGRLSDAWEFNQVLAPYFWKFERERRNILEAGDAELLRIAASKYSAFAEQAIRDSTNSKGALDFEMLGNLVGSASRFVPDRSFLDKYVRSKKGDGPAKASGRLLASLTRQLDSGIWRQSERSKAYDGIKAALDPGEGALPGEIPCRGVKYVKLLNEPDLAKIMELSESSPEEAKRFAARRYAESLETAVSQQGLTEAEGRYLLDKLKGRAASGTSSDDKPLPGANIEIERMLRPDYTQAIVEALRGLDRKGARALVESVLKHGFGRYASGDGNPSGDPSGNPSGQPTSRTEEIRSNLLGAMDTSFQNFLLKSGFVNGKKGELNHNLSSVYRAVYEGQVVREFAKYVRRGS